MHYVLVYSCQEDGYFVIWLPVADTDEEPGGHGAHLQAHVR